MIQVRAAIISAKNTSSGTAMRKVLSMAGKKLGSPARRKAPSGSTSTSTGTSTRPTHNARWVADLSRYASATMAASANVP
ncbi:hypothetical protein D3C72_2031660 [compost metagenome]